MRVFLAFYIPVVVLAFLATVTRVNPFALSSLQPPLLHLLPMAGFAVLFLAAILGALALWLLGARRTAAAFGAGGIVLTLLAATVASNVLRGRILASVGRQRGTALAEQVAHDRAAYAPPPEAMDEAFPHLSPFLLAHDAGPLMRGFWRGYNAVFAERFASLVDVVALRRNGGEAGRQWGLEVGRRAALNGEPPLAPPPAGEQARRLRERFPPAYVQGFAEGYDAGWQEGYRDGRAAERAPAEENAFVP